jgi:hypothetical protein
MDLEVDTPARMMDMESGVAISPTHDAIEPGGAARLAGQRGQESRFFPEHTYLPASYTPHPSGRPLPRRYREGAA